jgi:hypothetical protein
LTYFIPVSPIAPARHDEGGVGGFKPNSVPFESSCRRLLPSMTLPLALSLRLFPDARFPCPCFWNIQRAAFGGFAGMTSIAIVTNGAADVYVSSGSPYIPSLPASSDSFFQKSEPPKLRHSPS